MAVRAKFRYAGYSAAHSTREMRDADGNPVFYADGVGKTPRNEKIEVRTLVFSPVYSTDPKSENRLFWHATPSGELKLQMVNPEAWSQFEMGKCYYLDFSEAPDT